MNPVGVGVGVGYRRGSAAAMAFTRGVRWVATGGLVGRSLPLLLLLVCGCSKQPVVEDSVAELEKSFGSAAANPYVAAALVAARTNDYASGVIMLESVQRAPGGTPQQLMAVQDALQAMMAELTVGAERGDPQARAALARIERSRSQ
ncbi:MAG: hypothetical protein FJ387_22015 [Verrucomicrobia bacterium]|nr:hypothetical protein [Verrucomicrobiota bacterium]